MSLRVIKLPLWALEQADTFFLGERIIAFKAYHGHPPDNDSTLAEWWDVVPGLAPRIGVVARALPRVYPDKAPSLLRAVVEVAYLAARRAQPTVAPERASMKALALVRRWLDGEDVSSDTLVAAARAASAPTRTAETAWAAARATAHAMRLSGVQVSSYAIHACWAAEAAVCEPRAAWTAERAQQRADLDRLLLALNLPEPGGAP